MEQDSMTIHYKPEGMRGPEEDAGHDPGFLLSGIADTLEETGSGMQRVLCMALLLLLTFARLPCGVYCCQAAMFAVLLRLGFCVPAAFLGAAAGFAFSFRMGDPLACWQLPVCVLLWLSAGLWARRRSRWAMVLAVFSAQMTSLVMTGTASVYGVLLAVLMASGGAALSVLYLGAALSVCKRDELDGETRPLCVMAVAASIAGGVLAVEKSGMLTCALALYLTLEHAYVGGAQQALVCGGVLGSVAALGLGDVQVLAMLVCGGFIAGSVKVKRRCLMALLMLFGMGAACALLGGEVERLRLLVFCLPGMTPFLLLPPERRMFVTALVERSEPDEVTQSGAIAIRSASMIHAWAGLYEDTARMMEGLCVDDGEQNAARECISLLHKTSAAAHQVCERTLSGIQPDDEAFRRIRYELIRHGHEEVRVVYALRVDGRMEVLLLKPGELSPICLQETVSGACGVPMRPCAGGEGIATRALFEQVPPLTLEVGAATRSRSGEAVAGDSYISRALDGGRHVLALSDGMGSGVSALQESHAALQLTVESLKAGYTRAQALDVVNSLMLVCTGRDMYATMDLCVCDLHSGEAAFEKLGACASYVVRAGEIRSVGADTLPVGVLPDVEAKSLRMMLEEGDVVVMITDGVSDSYPGGEDGLREAIARCAWLHPQAVGERLIAGALAGGEAKDDMAVLCARVKRTMLT